MKILFIGNGHTYHNDMPAMIAALFAAMGQKMQIVVQAAAGKNLLYHAKRPDVAFNLRYGGYDAVVAQGKSVEFKEDAFREGAMALKTMADRTHTPIIYYMPFSPLSRWDKQRIIAAAYRKFCDEQECKLSPVGEIFSKLLLSEPSHVLFAPDGSHATAAGSYVAAVTLFYTISGRRRILEPTAIADPGRALGLSPEFCRKVHAEACRASRLYNG